MGFFTYNAAYDETLDTMAMDAVRREARPRAKRAARRLPNLDHFAEPGLKLHGE